jgi:hypothetical protein
MYKYQNDIRLTRAEFKVLCKLANISKSRPDYWYKQIVDISYKQIWSPKEIQNLTSEQKAGWYTNQSVIEFNESFSNYTSWFYKGSAVAEKEDEIDPYFEDYLVQIYDLVKSGNISDVVQLVKYFADNELIDTASKLSEEALNLSPYNKDLLELVNYVKKAEERLQI